METAWKCVCNSCYPRPNKPWVFNNHKEPNWVFLSWFKDQGEPWSLKHAFKKFREAYLEMTRWKGIYNNRVLRMRNYMTGQIIEPDMLALFGHPLDGKIDSWWFVKRYLTTNLQ